MGGSFSKLAQLEIVVKNVPRVGLLRWQSRHLLPPQLLVTSSPLSVPPPAASPSFSFPLSRNSRALSCMPPSPLFARGRGVAGFAFRR